MRLIEIRRASGLLLIGRPGAFAPAMLKASDRQRLDQVIRGLPRDTVALGQLRAHWRELFPGQPADGLSGSDIAKHIQRGLASRSIRAALLREARMPVEPADLPQVTSGVVNIGDTQRRLIIARRGQLPGEFHAHRQVDIAVAALSNMNPAKDTARQLESQAGRLFPNGKAPYSGEPLRRDLAARVKSGELEAAVIVAGPAAAAAAGRADATKNPANMSEGERVAEALRRCLPHALKAGGEGIEQSLNEMLKAENIAIMAATILAVALAHLYPPAGIAADAALLILAWYYGGKEAIEGVTAFAMATIDAKDATTEADLEAAAQAYGKAIGLMGPRLLDAIVNKYLKKGGGKNQVHEGPRGGPPSNFNKPGPSSQKPTDSRREFSGGDPVRADSPYHPDAVNKRSDEFYKHYDGAPGARTMSNIEARKWYLAEDAKIADRIDKTASLEDQARQAHSMRNENRTKARELMQDRVTADRLTREEPNKSFDQLVKEREDRGLSGDDVYKSIIESSGKTRPSVNKQLGVE